MRWRVGHDVTLKDGIGSRGLSCNQPGPLPGGHLSDGKNQGGVSAMSAGGMRQDRLAGARVVRDGESRPFWLSRYRRPISWRACVGSRARLPPGSIVYVGNKGTFFKAATKAWSWIPMAVSGRFATISISIRFGPDCAHSTIYPTIHGPASASC